MKNVFTNYGGSRQMNSLDHGGDWIFQDHLHLQPNEMPNIQSTKSPTTGKTLEGKFVSDQKIFTT